MTRLVFGQTWPCYKCKGTGKTIPDKVKLLLLGMDKTRAEKEEAKVPETKRIPCVMCGGKGFLDKEPEA